MGATLALDLGTKTGWALRNSLGEITSGTMNVTISAAEMKAAGDDWGRNEDPRFIRLWAHIDGLVRAAGVTKIVFEDVLFSEYTYQTQLWATFRAAVWAQKLSRPTLAFGCLNTATLKLVSTGHGGATKAMMAAHLVLRYPESFRKLAKPDPKKNLYVETVDGRSVDDNEVDAYHLLRYFIKHE